MLGKKTINISLGRSDNCDEVIISNLSRLARGDEIQVTIAKEAGSIAVSELQLLQRLSLVAKQYSFERISDCYTGVGVLRYQYDGADIPNSLSLSYSFNHIAGVCELFKDAFGHRLSEEFWRWKYEYGQNVHSPVFVKGNEVVAHYGLVPRMLLFMGEKYTGLQACDVMVKKQERGGIFQSTFAALFAFVLKQFDFSTDFIDENTPICLFGFPHGRHLLLGQRIKEYKNLGNLYHVKVTPNSYSRLGESVVHPIKPLLSKSDLKGRWVSAWNSMMKTANDVVLGVRDWRYGHRRFWCHPEYTYHFYTLDNAKDAVFVVKKCDKLSYQLIDYVGPLNHFREYLVSLYRYLLDQDSIKELNFWLLEKFVNELAAFAHLTRSDAGFTARFEGNAEFLERELWWVMMGDTDFL